MNRRNFLRHAGVISTWLGVTVVMQGCSSDDNPAAPAQGAGDIVGTIATNHGHSVAITSAQLNAGDGVTLGLSGGGHAHSITLSGQQVINIAGGQQVQGSSSSGGGHRHVVTFN